MALTKFGDSSCFIGDCVNGNCGTISVGECGICVEDFEVVPVGADNTHQEKWAAFSSGNACFGGLVCANHPP